MSDRVVRVLSPTPLVRVVRAQGGAPTVMSVPQNAVRVVRVAQPPTPGENINGPEWSRKDW